MRLSAAARATRRRFVADLERLGFVPGDRADEYVGSINTVAGKRTVAISLSHAFPYQKPSVTPVDPPIRGRSHQGSGEPGVLCLWPDQGEGWDPAMTAEMLLARVATWFEHDARNDWAAEDYAPDPDRLFERGHDLLVFDEDWPPKDGDFGRFAVWAPTASGRAYLAARPTAADRHPERSTRPRLANLFMLGTTVTHVGIWVRTTQVPSSMQKLGPFLMAIDAVRRPAVPQILQLVRRAHGGARRDLYVAVLYPDPATPQVERSLFVCAEIPAGRRLDRLDDIDVYAFESAPGDPESMRRRLPPKYAALATKRVAIFGVGALGSAVSLTLAKSGVGHEQLVDGDKLRPAHILRHAASALFVGATKVNATAQTIGLYAPSAQIGAFAAARWDPDEALSVIGTHDLVIDATGTPAYSLLLGELCRAAGRALITTYTQRNAEVGIVRLFRGARDACPACFELESWLGSSHPRVPSGGTDDYYETGCADPTTLAAAADIEATANAVARLTVRLLGEDWDDRNQIFVVLRAIDGADEPLNREGVHYATNPSAPNCPLCYPDD